MARPDGGHGWRRGAGPVALGAALILVAGALLTPGAAAEPDNATPTSLHLVTFDAAGTAGYRGPLTPAGYRSVLAGEQDVVLATVAAAAPVYRWTTALSGVAVELTPDQVEYLRNVPGIEAVEEDAVRTLAAASSAAAPSVASRGRGGQGVVVGVVDTGIWPDSPLFADFPGLGPAPHRGPAGFSGQCRSGEDWSRGVCNDKLVGASWFVSGFGEDRLASDEPLSPRDVRGHGTQMASIAAGNAEVSVDIPGVRRSFGGVAPRARLAAYKACWSAPDPQDDGCSTADLVAAVDRATRDGVDVLTLAVTGGSGLDTVERALLGAAEAGIVVVAAAGNDGAGGYAGHVSPWVTTVGGLTTADHTGAVDFGGRSVAGTMTARQPVTARVVLGRTIPAPASTRLDATVCTPGSLDASAATERIVVCERGALGRIEKSAAVERAGGTGMILVDTAPGSPAHDLHAVPTVHLDEAAGRRLTRWTARHPQSRVTLRPTTAVDTSPRVAPWSSGGDPGGSFVKPDLVAPATGVLAGSAPAHTGSRWTFASGTSAATAWTSGAAAVLLARHDWSAAVVRSALATSSAAVGGTLRSGAGALRLEAAGLTRLAYDVAVGDYRSWLRGDLADVNSPSLLVQGESTSRRRLTNVGGTTGTWQVSVTGFERHYVRVSPATLTLRPGRAASYRVTVGDGSLVGGLDQGEIVWTGANGVEVRIPVAVSR